MSRSQQTAKAPPNPPRSVATKLVGGPVLLRVVGDTQEPFVRYVLVFRLNRPYPKWPKDPDDPDGAAPLPKGATDPLGNYAIDTFKFDFRYSIFNFDPVGADAHDRDNCFIGSLATDVPDDAILPRLDKIPDAGRVRVRLRPLTPKPNGRPAYGTAYVRHPRIIRTRVDGSLYLRVISIPALDALKRIGCSETFVY